MPSPITSYIDDITKQLHPKLQIAQKQNAQRPSIFQAKNSGWSSSASLKYQGLTQSGCIDLWIKKCMFMTKTQFLYKKKNVNFSNGLEEPIPIPTNRTGIQDS